MPVAKLNDPKIFNTSVYQILDNAAGKPLLDIPLHESTLNLIENAFHTQDLGKLGQLCGILLQRLTADSQTWRQCAEHTKAFKARNDFAAFYTKLDTGLVVLTYGATEELMPTHATEFLTTYFLSRELHQQAVLAHAI